MKRVVLLLSVYCGLALAGPPADLERLEAVDSRIRESASLSGRPNVFKLTRKVDLSSWDPSATLEEKPIEDGVVAFSLTFAEGAAYGYFPVRHCCTEVIFAGLDTRSSAWTFFGQLRVGSTEKDVLSTLGSDTRKDDNTLSYCGLNECIHFSIDGGRVTRVTLSFYTG